MLLELRAALTKKIPLPQPARKKKIICLREVIFSP